MVSMNEDKASRYHRLGRRAGVLSTVWAVVILCALMFSGASASLRDWASIIAGGTPTLVVVLYVLVLSAIFGVAALPFGFYRDFLLERRYGLATETMGCWLTGHVKAGLIALVIAEVGATCLYFVLRHWPGYWWVMAGITYGLVLLIVVYLGPVALLPLFYRFRPLEKVELRDRLTVLASRAGARIMGVYEWTLSDRTKKVSAALAGIGNTRRVLLSDTLLAEYSDDEIEVILAHEIGHHVHKDIRTTVLYDTVLAFGVGLASHAVLQRAVPMFGLHTAADPAGIPLLVVTAATIGLAARPVLNAVSRAHERRADAYALHLTENPSAFISAMRRLGQQNLAEESPSRLVETLFYTHPPFKERLEAARTHQAR